MDWKDEFWAYEEDQIRWCYVRVPVLRRLAEEDRILNGLIDVLTVPGTKSQLKRMSAAERLSLMEKRIADEQRFETSQWFRVPAPEVFAASVLSIPDLPVKYLWEMLGGSSSEKELQAPVASWLAEQGCDVYAELGAGFKRTDLFGLERRTFLGLSTGEHFHAVELKNDKRELDRGFHQMSVYGQFAEFVYLACPPILAAEYVVSNFYSKGGRWDRDILNRVLKDQGFGLLLVEDGRIHKAIEPRKRTVQTANKTEMANKLQERKPIAHPER